MLLTSYKLTAVLIDRSSPFSHGLHAIRWGNHPIHHEYRGRRGRFLRLPPNMLQPARGYGQHLQGGHQARPTGALDLALLAHRQDEELQAASSDRRGQIRPTGRFSHEAINTRVSITYPISGHYSIGCPSCCQLKILTLSLHPTITACPLGIIPHRIAS